ncbi:VanZ family protein [Desulfobaculum bizertense]|uniref:VanZ like family protein n=1 Tax=Desulfobaculum bizertense DSM 18034 TaxID=1121442 RepID=A0A1T4VDL2_9BACT|nr:VanZ family protein [Desulfobaculum bizertense]UIJ37622.1 VanZ family protein [Desulfobaculum bizertense]SKA63069.1 VanZ like family protein [Desulfobaculum bizertense DSM 18034]
MQHKASPPEVQRTFFAILMAGIALLLTLSLMSDFMPPYRPLYGPVSLDNVLHGLAFACLACVAPLAFPQRLTALASLVFLALLGFSLEFWQIFLPTRRCTIEDALANLLGITIGGIIGFCLRKAVFKRFPPSQSSPCASHKKAPR